MIYITFIFTMLLNSIFNRFNSLIFNYLNYFYFIKNSIFNILPLKHTLKKKLRFLVFFFNKIKIIMMKKINSIMSLIFSKILLFITFHLSTTKGNGRVAKLYYHCFKRSLLEALTVIVPIVQTPEFKNHVELMHSSLNQIKTSGPMLKQQLIRYVDMEKEIRYSSPEAVCSFNRLFKEQDISQETTLFTNYVIDNVQSLSITSKPQIYNGFTETHHEFVFHIGQIKNINAFVSKWEVSMKTPFTYYNDKYPEVVSKFTDGLIYSDLQVLSNLSFLENHGHSIVYWALNYRVAMAVGFLYSIQHLGGLIYGNCFSDFLKDCFYSIKNKYLLYSTNPFNNLLIKMHQNKINSVLLTYVFGQICIDNFSESFKNIYNSIFSEMSPTDSSSKPETSKAVIIKPEEKPLGELNTEAKEALWKIKNHIYLSIKIPSDLFNAGFEGLIDSRAEFWKYLKEKVKWW